MLVFEKEMRARGWSKSAFSRRADVNQTVLIEVLNGTRIIRAESAAARKMAAALGWSEERASEGLSEVELMKPVRYLINGRVVRPFESATVAGAVAFGWSAATTARKRHLLPLEPEGVNMWRLAESKDLPREVLGWDESVHASGDGTSLNGA